MSQLCLTAAADTTTTHTHQFKIQSTVPPNNLHIENQISIATTTPTLALDHSNSNPTDIKGNKCHIINAATTLSIKTNDETTLHELPNNNNYHDKLFNVRIPPTTKVFTPMTATTSLLWILLLITTITRAATLAIQGPVIKRGSTVCLVEETLNVSSGGQQFMTDEYPVRTWDVWLLGRQIYIPADEGPVNWSEDEEKRDKHAKDNLQRVTQRTAATVQWMVFESDSGDFDAEALVGSASYEVRREGIQCRFWEAWLNVRTTQLCRAIYPYGPPKQPLSDPLIHQLRHPPSHPSIQLLNKPSTHPFSHPQITLIHSLLPASQLLSHPLIQPSINLLIHLVSNPPSQPSIQPPIQRLTQPSIQPSSYPLLSTTHPLIHPPAHSLIPTISQPASHPLTHQLTNPMTHILIRTSSKQSTYPTTTAPSVSLRPADQGQLSKLLSACNLQTSSDQQTNAQTLRIFSILTPAIMMRPSLVAKRPVQQAMVAHHVAAELHHKGFRVTSWDVWIRLVELPRVEGGPQHE